MASGARGIIEAVSTSRSIRSVTAADGTRLEYTVQGSGPAIVLTNGLTTTHLFWKYLVPRWLDHHTVVMWDLPGHGTSGPARSDYSATIEAQPDLLARVMDAAGVESAVQMGFSVGCQISLEMARQHPERCSALVLLLGSAGRVLSTTKLPVPGPVLLRLLRDTPDRLFEPLARGFAQLATADISYHAGRAFGMLGARAPRRDIRDMMEHMLLVDPGTIRRMAASAEAHSAFDILGSLELPMLIVAGDRDPFAPAEEVGMAMHRAAPRSEFVLLEGGTHTALLDDPDPIAAIIQAFLARHQLTTVPGQTG
jgi:pimeloyl-ACP methyl ester carboxylesterase